MAYTLFEPCTLQIDNKTRRAARAKCGYCPEEETIAINTVQGGGEDNDIVERIVTQKFEHHGWKIGKTVKQHRCPKCFSAIKLANVRKPYKVDAMDNKVVSINAEKPREMSREEKRIIFERLNMVYVSEKVGYSEDWSDEKVAADVKAPRAWVSAVREEMFGPDINEKSVTALNEAREVLTELSPVIQQLQKLIGKAEAIEKNLKQFVERAHHG